MWLLMAPTPARRVDPMTGAPFPPGAALISDPALSAAAAAAKASASAGLGGMVLHIGDYLFDEDGQVLGRMAAAPSAGGERGDGGGGAAAAGGAAGAAPPSTPPPVRAGGKGCGGEHDGQHRPSSGMTRALARLKGKRARTVVPVDADAGGGGSGEGGGVVAERDQQA